jgi:hypothetical protein
MSHWHAIPFSDFAVTALYHDRTHVVENVNKMLRNDIKLTLLLDGVVFVLCLSQLSRGLWSN